MKLADAYSIRWHRAESEEELEKILKQELDKEGPSIIEVRKILDEDNIFPMVAPWMNLSETLWNRECLK
jgi:thiamine pyrophosphate-dependent acetolactate synthase large subunit-like protein